MSSIEPQRLGQRLSLLIQRVRVRIEGLFDQAWAAVPSQPVLNVFLFLAALAVIFIDAPPIAFAALGVGQGLFYAWCLLSLAGPIALLGARYLIMHARRRRRLFGFWLRASADIMQFLALTAYLSARLFAPADDGVIYSQIVISGVWVLQGIWVIRDIWALILIERTATHLNSLVYGR